MAASKNIEVAEQVGKKKFTDRNGFHVFVLILPYALLFFTFILLPIVIGMGLSFTYFETLISMGLIFCFF